MGYAFWKRGMDISVATLLLVATLPLWLCTALALLCVQGPPILFRQSRLGRHRVPFTMLKFRTMFAGPPPHLPDRPVGRHPDDPRITPLGRLLRRLAIDELPQLVNVLRGEMSIVGPRPLPVEDIEQAGWLDAVDETERARRLEWLIRRHAVLPGMTSLWQISRKPEADFENWITCDLAYVASASLRRDLGILVVAPFAVLRGREASPVKDTRSVDR